MTRSLVHRPVATTMSGVSLPLCGQGSFPDIATRLLHWSQDYVIFTISRLQKSSKSQVHSTFFERVRVARCIGEDIAVWVSVRVTITGNCVKKKANSQNKNRRVLGGYKKIGTTFVPPMIHRVGPANYTSWSGQTMPELIWWDVIIDRTSRGFASKVAEEIAKYFKTRDDHECWWAFISDYTRLGTDDMRGLKGHLRQANILTHLNESLLDFLNLYPACPLSKLLDEPPTSIVDVDYLQRFENRMRDLEGKHSRIAVLIQAQAIYMGFMLGKFYVKKGLALADFPEVEKYPATELSRRVGASVCATANMMTGSMLPKYSEDSWVLYFWQRSLELRPLDFTHLENP